MYIIYGSFFSSWRTCCCSLFFWQTEVVLTFYPSAHLRNGHLRFSWKLPPTPLSLPRSISFQILRPNLHLHLILQIHFLGQTRTLLRRFLIRFDPVLRYPMHPKKLRHHRYCLPGPDSCWDLLCHRDWVCPFPFRWPWICSYLLICKLFDICGLFFFEVAVNGGSLSEILLNVCLIFSEVVISLVDQSLILRSSDLTQMPLHFELPCLRFSLLLQDQFLQETCCAELD